MFCRALLLLKCVLRSHILRVKLNILKMAAVELDPLFVKGLRLLHSKNKDSAEQLKQLLDEAIAQSKQSVHAKDRVYTSVKLDSDSKLHLKKTSRETSEVSSYSKITPDNNRDRKPEKRPYEKSKPDSPESLGEAKIPKLETPQVYNYYPQIGSPDIPKLEQYVSKKEEDTDSSDENADAGDFAMEMGLACVICKQIEVTQGNQLIECQECHSLYHQECHRPPASDYDVNDPRRVWYCAKCTKSMKKMATKTQKTAKTVVTSTTKEPVTPTKITKSDSPPAQILPFKRTELKPTITQGNTQTSANKPIGLAGLAANFISRTTASTTTTNTSSSRVPKTTAPTVGTKSQFSTITIAKTTSGSSTLLSKMTISSSAIHLLPTTTITSSTSTVTSSSQKLPTTTSSAKGLRLLSTAVASASTRAAPSAPAGNGNTGHKVASCSPLMSADKRLQIMKKKASKQQEKRRLSSK